MTMRAILISLAAMAACAQPAPPSASETPVGTAAPATADEATAADACGAARFQHLIGARADQIDQTTLPAGARILTPDMMVTQDFRADRLNIMVGTDGIVGSLRCY